jgi:conjugative transposon TraM protein
MNEVKHSPAFLRKRKMLLVLPVLILPFITLAFWSMGGGKENSTKPQQAVVNEGLNLQLPDARFKDEKGLNKLNYYEKAASDSAKREELLRNDPYYKIHLIKVSDSSTGNLPDSNEDKVYRKLAELDRELNRKSKSEMNDPLSINKEKKENSAPFNNAEIDRLEQMMQTMQRSGTGLDPEMNQLNGMLDKIMDIQHPERIPESIKKNSFKQPEKVFPVTMNESMTNISLLVNETEMRSKLHPVNNTGFYSVIENFDNELSNSIEAVIHDTRTLVNGSIVKFRLLTDIFINGTLIPKGNFVFGKASLNGERLNIDITSIRFKKSIFPVALIVYDMDGIDGVFIPGAISRDVAKESSDRAIQGIALNSLDPSVGAQAASAGIEAAKNLLTKKVKLVKVVVKAGYKVLLKDKK